MRRDCIRACPTDAWQPQATGWVVRVGAKHGRHPLTGPQIARFVPNAKLQEIVVREAGQRQGPNANRRVAA
ncbi:MAG TPA: hypothetical protein VM223_20420 [Planctomycetota bacterium]|nr:hypothetical protein [Planctomycetota bacterium]